MTFEYIKGREHAPKGVDWDKAVSHWKTLKSDDDAVFDKEIRFDAADIQPMITYGTNPGMGMGITEHIPVDDKSASFKKSLDYMGFQPGESLLGKKIDYVFLGACTNGQCSSCAPDRGKSHCRDFNDQQYNEYCQPIDHSHKPSPLFRIYYFLFTILLYSDKESNFLL